jgi:hypothetical protein
MRSILALGVLVVACSSESANVAPALGTDAGVDDAVAPRSDAGAAAEADAATEPKPDASVALDAAMPTAQEMEPNNGQPETAVNALSIPGAIRGTIDPADDIDVFSIDVKPGEYWEWRAEPTADLSPLITMFDTAPNSLNPTALGWADAGASAVLQHFALRPGKFVVAMRDARNRAPSQKKGGPSFGYTLRAARGTLASKPVTFPSTMSGKLTSVGSIDTYAFTTTKGKGWDIVVKAQRKSTPSTLDARISLFDVAGNRAIITNDNVSQSITDSQIGSNDALSGAYLVIVENEGTNPADLSYEIEFKSRP